MDIFKKIIGCVILFCLYCFIFPFIGWLIVRFTRFKKIGLFLIAAFSFSDKLVSRVCRKYKVFRCSSCGRDDCRNWTCANYKNPLN